MKLKPKPKRKFSYEIYFYYTSNSLVLFFLEATTFGFLSPSILYINGMIQKIVFCVWLYSLNVMFLDLFVLKGIRKNLFSFVRIYFHNGINPWHRRPS